MVFVVVFLFYFENLLGLTEYASFLTKFENRTAKIMTGNPTNCTGNSKIGGESWACTALSLKSIMANISADNSANDGNITCSRIFIVNYFDATKKSQNESSLLDGRKKKLKLNIQSCYSNAVLN